MSRLLQLVRRLLAPKKTMTDNQDVCMPPLTVPEHNMKRDNLMVGVHLQKGLRGMSIDADETLTLEICVADKRWIQLRDEDGNLCKFPITWFVTE